MALIYLVFMFQDKKSFKNLIALLYNWNSHSKVTDEEIEEAYYDVRLMLLTGWIICLLGGYKTILGLNNWYFKFERK